MGKNMDLEKNMKNINGKLIYGGEFLNGKGMEEVKNMRLFIIN